MNTFKAEEPPTALLLAHAAFLTSKKGAFRRAALWYMFAADRLEKAGVVSEIYGSRERKLIAIQKPLALYLFRQAHQLYRQQSNKELSPSFWENEDRSPLHWKGFDAVLPGIEHELGISSFDISVYHLIRAVKVDYCTRPAILRAQYDTFSVCSKNLQLGLLHPED